MKQKVNAKVWSDSEGHQVPTKYLTDLVRLSEIHCSTIAAEAEKLHHQMWRFKRDLIAMILDLRDQHTKAEGKPAPNVTSFYTFDREYRIEYDLKADRIRVFRAPTKNCKFDEYEEIALDLREIDHKRPEGLLRKYPLSVDESFSKDNIGNSGVLNLK